MIFLDESGVNLAMTRLYGWAPRAERAGGHAPKNWKGNVTLCAGVCQEGLLAPLLLFGPMTGDAFEAYLEQFLLPELRPGDVVLCDNLSAHKRGGFAALIANAGAELVYLPPYSPDLNPIEKMWSQVKSWLRHGAARTLEDLENNVVSALRTVTPTNARNYFRSCGYIVSPLCKLL